jgi:hypothetical protein
MKSPLRRRRSAMSATAERLKEYKVRGDELVARAKQLIHEGNVRRLIVKDEKGETILEVPLTVGVVGAMLVPVWVALGAIAALAVRYTLVVELHEPV